MNLLQKIHSFIVVIWRA